MLGLVKLLPSLIAGVISTKSSSTRLAKSHFFANCSGIRKRCRQMEIAVIIASVAVTVLCGVIASRCCRYAAQGMAHPR